MISNVLSNVPVIKTILVSTTLFGSFVLLGLWAKALPRKWGVEGVEYFTGHRITTKDGPLLLLLLGTYVLAVGSIESYFILMEAPYNAFHIGMMLFAWLFLSGMAWLGYQTPEPDLSVAT